MKKTILTLLAIAGTIAFPSCSESLEQGMEQDVETATSSKVTFRLSESKQTKSSIAPDEMLIEEICIMVYREDDGKLVAYEKSKTAGDIEIELIPGTYRFCSIANSPSFSPPTDLSDLQSSAIHIDSIDQIGTSIPMCWSGETRQIVAGKDEDISISMERLVSKISLNIDMNLIDGLKITSVRMLQAARIIRPFMEGGSRILTSEETFNGDYANDEDITRLMSGESIVLYAPENCQGELLPDNSDPWNKIPEKITGADLCTYIEISGVWLEDAFYEGEVKYRFYLGEDATSNFDIRRNSIQTMTLFLEEENLERVSWKIDNSKMEAVDWEATADFRYNFHTEDDFYVTERIRIDVYLDKRGEKYWKKYDNGFVLSGVGADGKEIIHFNRPTHKGNGHYFAIGTCIGNGRFDVVMINKETGEAEYTLDCGVVKHPEIYASYDEAYADQVVEELDDVEMTINGTGCKVAFFLTDQAGYNLNQGHYYGCDFSICDWEMEIDNPDGNFDITDNAEIKFTSGVTGSDGYAVLCEVNIKNNGIEQEQNRRLTKSLGLSTLELRLMEHTSGSEGYQPASLFCDDINVTIRPVPVENRQDLESEFLYAVVNPSNLPIYIRGAKFNTITSMGNNDLWHIISKDITGNSTTKSLVMSRMPQTICSLDSDGARSVKQENEIWYAADDGGIEQYSIDNQYTMFHTFESDLLYESDGWKPKISGSLDLYDTVENHYTYGTAGFHNRGMYFYSDKTTSGHHENKYDGFTCFDDYGILITPDGINMINEMPEIRLRVTDNQLTATSSKPVNLKITVSGTLTGHIRCVSVDDDSYSVHGRYFKQGLSFHSSDTYTLGSHCIAVDNSCIENAFKDLRAKPFYSVRNAKSDTDFIYPPEGSDSIREYLKPTDMELTISIESDTPIAVKYDETFDFSHETSAPVTWKVSKNQSITIVPSTYSGFDAALLLQNCPFGSEFIRETVSIEPEVTYSDHNRLYLMTAAK